MPRRPPRSAARPAARPADDSALAARYPHVAAWVRDSWVEIGRVDGGGPAFVRALDAGGVVWEGAARYRSLDDALAALDAGIAAWRGEQGE